MNSLLEIINPGAPSNEKASDSTPGRRDFSSTCHRVLEEAQALGLGLDDVIAAIHNQLNHSNKSN